MKSDQKLKFDITDKIELNATTINKVVYTTHWYEIESYWKILFTYNNQTSIFSTYTVHTKNGTA